MSAVIRQCKGPVINYRERGGGATQREGGGKIGTEKVLAMLKGGGTTNFGALLTQELEVLGILEGRAQNIATFQKKKVGGGKFYPGLGEGDAQNFKSFQPPIPPSS